MNLMLKSSARSELKHRLLILTMTNCRKRKFPQSNYKKHAEKQMESKIMVLILKIKLPIYSRRKDIPTSLKDKNALKMLKKSSINNGKKSIRRLSSSSGNRRNTLSISIGKRNMIYLCDFFLPIYQLTYHKSFYQTFKIQVM